MSIIRPLKPRKDRHVCPDCHAPEGLFIDDTKTIVCRMCGWQDTEPLAIDLTEPPKQKNSDSKQDLRDLRNFQKISYSVSNRSTITVWGMAAYESALAHIKRREWDEAIKALQRALDMDHDFIEAHLWMGRLLTDEKKQRDHLSYAIGYQYQRSEAILELMYLDGRISLEQLEQALYTTQEVEVKEALVPVEAETEILACPVCGGYLTTHPITGHVECAYCGHIEDASPQSSAGEALTTALLHQKSQGVQWVIHERIIHCENCGAERTIPDGQMGSYCLYCGSNHIIIRDALDSFRQPDSLIPFTVPRKEAEVLIQERLYDTWEQFKGLFVNNKVKEATFTGTYLPFWIFDVLLEVNLRYSTYNQSSPPPRSQQDFPESFTDYIYPAVISPAPRLIEKIDRYDLSKLQTFTPSALASHSAEIYQINFDKASLEVRGRIRRLVMEKYESRNSNLQNSGMVNIWSTLRHMSFQLALLPVWIATLIEDDGDVRIGLVNGQTGKAVLGKARKPERLT